VTPPEVPTTTPQRALLAHIAGPVTSAVIALVWVLLALWRPTTTFHFAPLLVALGWPYSTRAQLGRPSIPVEATVAVLGGLAVSLGTTVGLVLAGNLEGPTFWESNDAPLESVLMTLIGAALGARALVRKRSGWLLPDEQNGRGRPDQPAS